VSRVPFIAPALPRLRAAPPTGENWLYEVKLDGYRIQLQKSNMTREPEWVGSSIDKRLHDLGDRMHDQVTEFDPSKPLRPPRYWFGIDPNDPSHIICADMKSEPRQVMATTVTEDTLWVTEYIREVVRIGKKSHIRVRPRSMKR